MKKIMAKYNYAFGYVKGYFTLCGLVGLASIIFGIVSLFMGDKLSGDMSPTDIFVAAVLPGVVIVLIAVAIILTTRKKCPEDKKGLVGLTLSMMLVGFAAAFVLSWKIFKFMLSLVGIHFGSSSGADTFKYASFYYEHPDEFKEWSLYNSCGNYAVLRNTESGNTITVYPHNDDGLVRDDSGNLYYPK